MEKHILNISGKRSTAFIGEEIAIATNRDSNEETKFEWDAVRVFRVDPEWAKRQQLKTGKKIDPYRVGVAKCTIWEGERDRYRVFYCRTLPQVLGIVRMHLPIFDQEIAEKLKLNNAPIRTLEHESSRSPVE
jgi:hypothetical protein